MEIASTPSSQTAHFRAVVSAVVERARNSAGNAEALSAQLQDIGIGGENGARYSVSAISNWVQGRTMPPGDVLLAVAFAGNESLDDQLFGTTTKPAAGAAPQGEDDELRTEVARLQAEIMHLYSRIGEPYQRDTSSADDEHGRMTGTDR